MVLFYRLRILAVALLMSVVAGGVAMSEEAPVETKEAIFAGGCFWCVEAAFDGREGVVEAISGYTGGTAENAVYKKVSSGKTDHLEALKVVYDPKVVSYDELLTTFWESIDPTDDGGQFADRGDHYRTAIFVNNEEEKAIAEKSKKRVEAFLEQPVATQILEAKPFYPAEDYHQDYSKKNSTHYKLYYYGSGRADKTADMWGKEGLNKF